jgi:putative transposase
LWINDFTELRTHEGKAYCAVVLDTFFRRCRRLVDRFYPDRSARHLCAERMAIATASEPQGGGIIHSGHGVQVTSWAFTDRARRSGLVPSMELDRGIAMTAS